MPEGAREQELAERYRSYLGLCNDDRLDRFDEVVAAQLLVSDEPVTREAYAARVGAVRATFPDYRWEIRHLVVQGPLVAARLLGTGTHTGADWLGLPATGVRVSVPEHAFYVFVDGMVSEVWSTSDRLATLRLLEQGSRGGS